MDGTSPAAAARTSTAQRHLLPAASTPRPTTTGTPSSRATSTACSTRCAPSCGRWWRRAGRRHRQHRLDRGPDRPARQRRLQRQQARGGRPHAQRGHRLRPHGIRVNAVNMAQTDTPMVARAYEFVKWAMAQGHGASMAGAKSQSLLQLADSAASGLDTLGAGRDHPVPAVRRRLEPHRRRIRHRRRLDDLLTRTTGALANARARAPGPPSSHGVTTVQ